MEDEPLIPLEDFEIMVRVVPGGSVVVTWRNPGKEEERLQVTTKDPGVVIRLGIRSGPREWSPKSKIKWPEGFVQYAKLNYYSQFQVARKDFEHGQVHEVIGFLPDSSPLLRKGH